MDVVLLFPGQGSQKPGMGKDLAAGRTVSVQAVIDGADANTATTVLNYVNAFVAGYDASLSARFTLVSGATAPAIVAEPALGRLLGRSECALRGEVARARVAVRAHEPAVGGRAALRAPPGSA